MQKGVRITFGADAHHEPFRMARELELAVELGMPEMDTIVNATAGAAEACGIERDVGTLTSGKLADLLILGSDPLKDIRALKDIVTIVQGGKVVEF
jgi:imidazolonepropionase-like amidohydrolase